jgi:hypothetical protein
MPYQRINEKEQQQQEQQQQQPMPQQQEQEDLQTKRVQRGQPDLNQPQGAEQGFRMAQELSRPGEGSALGPDIEANEDEQAEYERGVAALGRVLYENDKTSSAIVSQLTPKERVGSIAKASMLTMTQLDEKLDFDETVIPELTKETVDRIIDLYENKYDEELSEQDAQAALGATWEGLMEVFGIDEDSYGELTAGMTTEQFKEQEKTYKQFLGDA